jgi:ATP-dependent RNA helicase DeaD
MWDVHEALREVLEDQGFERPTALQRAVLPVVRRGGAVVVRAGRGSGRLLGVGLGLLERLAASRPAGKEEAGGAPAPGPRALVLVPTFAAAEGVARSLAPYATALDLWISVPGGAWRTPPAAAALLVAPPLAVRELVRRGRLKLDAVEAVWIDGAAALDSLGLLDVVDALLSAVPEGAQRLVTTDTLSPRVRQWLDRRLRRAIHWPPEAAAEELGPEFAPPPAAPAVPGGRLGYWIAESEEQKLLALGEWLARRGEEGPVAVFVATQERADALSEELFLRGFAVGHGVADAEADALVLAGTPTAPLPPAVDITVSFDLPPDRESLAARHGEDPRAWVIALPSERAHLEQLAREANVRLELVDLGVPADLVDPVERFRDELRRAADEEDLGAAFLVLEPLFAERSAVEWAAAAVALLRRRSPAPAEPAPPLPAWVRLFVSVGRKDGVRPADLVGAIAGEAQITSEQIGRIEIGDTYSRVEVAAEVAPRVIERLNGVTIRGRAVRVDVDRGGRRRGTDGAGPGASES